MAPVVCRRQAVSESRLFMAHPIVLRCGVNVEPVASAQGIDKRNDENEAAGENRGQAQYPAASRWLGPSRGGSACTGRAAQGRGEKGDGLHHRGGCTGHGFFSFASNFAGAVEKPKPRDRVHRSRRMLTLTTYELK
jgi:hypothetical protein